MRRAVFLSLLAVGVAFEMELGALDGLGSIQHHGLTAVSTEDKAGEHIGFVHVLGRPALVRTHIPNDIPEFLRDERLMGVLDNDLFTFGNVNSGFILVGDGGTLLQMGMAEVGLILQYVSNRSTAPTIGTLHVHSSLSFAILSVVVMGGSEYLLILQNTCDLIRTFAACTQFEDIFYNGSSFIIGNNLLAVCGTLLIAIRCLTAVALTTLGLHPLDGTHLFTGVLGMEFVCPVADGIEIAAACHQRIYTIIDRNETDSLLREVDFCIVTHLRVLTTESAEVL